MKERPILYSSPMVRAIFEDRKTMTRRVAKPLRDGSLPVGGLPVARSAHVAQYNRGGRLTAEPCPYGQPGDRLWVRETWRTDSSLDAKSPRDFCSWPVQYLADGAARTCGALYGNTHGKTRASIHMPRWASRITLEITGVRVERVQEISEADAIAEGVHRIEIGSGYHDRFSATPVTWADVVEQHAPAYEDPRFAFRDLWDGINEQRGFGWLANPYVWVIEFKRIPQEQAA